MVFCQEIIIYRIVDKQSLSSQERDYPEGMPLAEKGRFILDRHDSSEKELFTLL
jgi:hypothetical protein